MREMEDVIITTFGDMLKVPGTSSSLAAAQAAGADVRIVSSPLDALPIAAEHPEKKVIFLAVGFETTAPTRQQRYSRQSSRAQELLPAIGAETRAARHARPARRR